MAHLRVLTPELGELTISRVEELAFSPFSFVPGIQELHRAEQTVSYRIPRNALGIQEFSGVLSRLGVQLPSKAQWAPGAASSISQGMGVHSERPLYPHQHVAFQRALDRGALLLGDQPGLGKTASGASIAQARLLISGGTRAALILAPSYLAGVWADELRALGYLAPQEQMWVARGSKPSPETSPWAGARWLFCHYDLLRFWWSALQHNKLCAVIFDEAHLLKSSRSQRTRAARLVTSGSATRIVMTGTPVQNRLSEAHTLLTLTTGPQTWGSSVAFRQRYAGAFHNGYGWQDSYPTHESELQERLDELYLRRDVSVLETPLPSRTRQRLVVPCDNNHLAQVRAALQGYSPRDILDALRRSQLGQGTIEWLTKLRKATSLGKTKSTLEHVTGLLEQGDSVVVFVWERATAQFLASQLEAACITGQDTLSQRDQIRLAWSSNPQPSALVATYGALSTGVTLTKANHVVLHDLDFVPATMLQAEARVYRIGQTRPVQSWWSVAEDSLDPIVFRLVQRKAPATALFGEHDTQALADFFGDDALEEELQDLLAWSMRKEPV